MNLLKENVNISIISLRFILVGFFISSWLFLFNSYALSDERISLKMDLNNVDSIQVDSSEVIFLSNDGSIIFDLKNNVWRFDLKRKYPGITLTQEDYKYRPRKEDQQYPESAVRATYVSVFSRIARDLTEMLLLNLAGEGAVWGTHCVVDTLARFSYCFPFRWMKSIEFTNAEIWLGHFNGITRIQRFSDKRSDFVVLPAFQNDSKFLVDGYKLWIAVDGLGIEMVDASVDSFTFWSITDIFGEYPKKLSKWSERYKFHQNEIRWSIGKAVFTNIQQDFKNIYVGCRFVSGVSYLTGRSCLLIYSKEKHKWTWKVLDGIDGISLLRLEDDVIWIGANHLDMWEGGGVRTYGSVFLYDLLEDTTHFFPDIDKWHLVTDIKLLEGTVKILTWPVSRSEGTYRRKKIFLIDKSNLQVSTISDTLFNGSKTHEEYLLRFKDYEVERLQGLSPIGLETLPDKFAKMLFKPKVVKIDIGHPNVLTSDY